MIKARDPVIVTDLNGNELFGTVINVSDYREPAMKYAVDIHGFSDVVFVGDSNIRLLEDT